jgi:hypothetical protein
MRHSVFTVEVCARMDLAPTLLDELRAIVQSAPERMTRSDAWGRHAAAAAAVLRWLGAVERGCWEYFDDENTAMAMFEDWCRPIVECEVPRQAPSGLPGYRDAAPRYLAFTMVYLLARDSPSDLSVRGQCSMREADLWLRRTFASLLGVVQGLSFASVKADTMYLVPRDHDWGLTPDDLATEKYQYLRVLRDG